jgi:hypothetical protein
MIWACLVAGAVALVLLALLGQEVERFVRSHGVARPLLTVRAAPRLAAMVRPLWTRPAMFDVGHWYVTVPLSTKCDHLLDQVFQLQGQSGYSEALRLDNLYVFSQNLPGAWAKLPTFAAKYAFFLVNASVRSMDVIAGTETVTVPPLCTVWSRPFRSRDLRARGEFYALGLAVPISAAEL